jgi:hypothetical protein
MPDCERLATCPFFNDKMANMPAMSGIYKQKYCREDYQNCARYMVFVARGKEAVPRDLFPNQLSRARDIIGR